MFNALVLNIILGPSSDDIESGVYFHFFFFINNYSPPGVNKIKKHSGTLSQNSQIGHQFSPHPAVLVRTDGCGECFLLRSPLHVILIEYSDPPTPPPLILYSSGVKVSGAAE